MATDPDLNRLVEEKARRIREALDSVRPGARGVPVSQVASRIVAALREQDEYLSKESVHQIAQLMSDPVWVFKHPLRHRRAMRAQRQREERADERCLDEAVDLNTRLLNGLETAEAVWKHDSAMTFDRCLQVVTIDPWSEELAERIRALAHPVEVIVRRADPPAN